MAKVKVSTECQSCSGTGIYVGFAEPNGTGAVCGTCNGTGNNVISYTPFKKRKLRKNIERVRLSWGRGKDITYEQFLAGDRPKDDND